MTWTSPTDTNKAKFSKYFNDKTVVFNNQIITFLLLLKAIFHLAEFSSRNDIFFCLLTPTLFQLVFKEKKMSLAQRGKFHLVENDLQDTWLQTLSDSRLYSLAKSTGHFFSDFKLNAAVKLK